MQRKAPLVASVAVGAVLVSVGGVVAIAVAAPPSAGDPFVSVQPLQDAAVAPAPQEQPYEQAFGYEIGEQRRYVLEPVRSLRSGESAWWSIELEGIDGEGDDVRITFNLEHQRSEVIRDIFGGEAGRVQVVDVNVRLTVNRFGFPERLVMQEQADVGGREGSLSDIRTTVFTLDAEGERYVKQVRINGREWSFNIAVASHDDLDFDVPVGMYAYVPTALRCLGVPGEAGRPSRCANGDAAFANPGLLSLALPVMWEEQVNEKAYLFFTPNGVGTLPGGLIDMNRLMRRERDHLRNFTRYFNKKTLEIEDYVVGAEIGPRTLDAWLLDGSGEMREVYTEADGTVLKVNLDPHPVTRGERWIRLQFPSEY